MCVCPMEDIDILFFSSLRRSAWMYRQHYTRVCPPNTILQRSTFFLSFSCCFHLFFLIQWLRFRMPLEKTFACLPLYHTVSNRMVALRHHEVSVCCQLNKAKHFKQEKKSTKFDASKHFLFSTVFNSFEKNLACKIDHNHSSIHTHTQVFVALSKMLNGWQQKREREIKNLLLLFSVIFALSNTS